MNDQILYLIEDLKNTKQSDKVKNYITLLEKENISLEKYLEIKVFLNDYLEEYETNTESIITSLKERIIWLQDEIQQINQDNYYNNDLKTLEKYQNELMLGNINLHEYLEINDFISDCEYKIEKDEWAKIREFKKRVNDIIVNQTSFLPLLKAKKEWKININLDDSWNIILMYKKNVLNLISVGILFLLFFIVVSFIVTESLFATLIGSLFWWIFILFLMFPLLKNNNKIIDKQAWYFYPQRFQKNIYDIKSNFKNHINYDWTILYGNDRIYEIKDFYAIQIIKSTYNIFEINIVMNKIDEEESIRFNLYRGNSQEKIQEIAQILKNNLNIPIWNTSEL